MRFKEILYKDVHHPRIMARWDNCGIQMEDSDKVDWEANEEAIKAIPTHQCHWLTKRVSGMSRGKKMMKSGARVTMVSVCAVGNGKPQLTL